MRKIILILILAAAGLLPQSAVAQVILKADTVDVSCGNSSVFLVPVRVRNFTDIAALQYTFQWNPAQLDYQFITDINPDFVGIAFDSTNLIAQGKFTFSWSQLNSLNLNDDDILLQVAFTRIGGPASALNFIDDPTAIFTYNGAFDEVPTVVNPGLVKPIDQAAPTITCPVSLTVPSVGPTVVNNIAPLSLSDDCGTPAAGWASSGATTASFPNDPDASGALFNLGLSTVTYTATDIVGNTATCSFTVNVEFTIGEDLTFLPIVPSAACGQNIAIDIVAFNFDTIAAFQFSMGWDPAVLQFNSVSNFSPTLNLSAANFGTGNAGNGVFSVGWDGPFTGLTLNGGDVVFTMNFTVLGSGSLDFTSNPTAPFAFSGVTFPPIEVPMVTVNTQILVNDTEAPTITCPADVTVQAPGSVAVPNIAPTSVDDNCAAPNVGWLSTGVTINNVPNDPDASGTLFNLGTSTVTYTATDAAGLTAQCSFNVTVEFGAGSTDLTLVASSSNAACGSDFFIDVTVLNFNDIAGLQYSLNWDPALIDYVSVSNFNPALNLDMSHFGEGFTNLGQLSFSWTGPLNGVTLPDNAVLFRLNLTLIGSNGTPIVFTSNPTTIQGFSGATFPPDEIDVITFDGQVNLVDNVAPVITCPANVTVDAPQGSLTATVGNLQPTSVSDNCGGTPAVTYVQSGATTGSGTGNANGDYNSGVTTVTYTAEDANGNEGTCSFTVTVNADNPVGLTIGSVQADCQGSDTITTCVTVDGFTDIIGLEFSLTWDTAVLELLPPFTNALPGFTLNNGMFFNYSTANQGLLIFFGSILSWPNVPNGDTLFCLNFAVDNPSGASPLNFQAPLRAVQDGTFALLPVVGNNGTFTGGADNTPPAVTCPVAQSVNPLQGECTATFDPPLPTATDACGVIDTITRVPDTDIFNGGTTLVTYTVTDEAGNSATCTFNVTVTDANAPQLISCPSNLTINVPTGECNAPGNWTVPVFDDCSTFTVTNNYFPGDALAPCMPTTIIYEATDFFGNTSTCQFNVLVLESDAPSITCPADITVNPVTSCDTIVTFAMPVVTDNCDTDVDVACNATSGDVFPAGITTITCAALDDCNNLAQCTFNVIVVDAAPPVLSACPSDITVDAEDDSCGANVDWTAPTGSDLCDPLVNVTTTDQPGSFFGVGDPIVVTYTATDDSFNESTCTFTVTVVDVTPPVLSGCPTDPILVSLPGMDCDTVLNWQEPSAMDNCTNFTLTSNFDPGHNFPTGDTMVVYIALDEAGNADTCSFRVVVRDNVPPVLTGCPTNIPPVDADGECFVPVTWVAPTATDNCSVPTITSPYDPDDLFPIGETEVQIIAEDASGNYDTCTFTVTVLGLPPGFDLTTVPDDVVSNACDTTITFTLPAATGFCDPATVTSDPESPATFGQGVHTITFTATDGVVTVTTTMTVTVMDNVDPVMLCPSAPVEVNVGGEIISGSGFITAADTVAGCAGVELSFALPQATDNCAPAPTVAQSTGQTSGTVFAIGTHTVTFVATDAAGNTSTCSVNINVTGLAALTPSADPNPGCEGESVVISAPAIPGATYVWTKLPGTVLSSTGNSYSIETLSASDAGDYAVIANVGGCVTAVGIVTLEVITAPTLQNDLFTIEAGTLDTFNVFANDGIIPGGNYEICPDGILPNPLPAGLTYIGDGNFVYQEQLGESISFTYQICYCDGVQGEMATATIMVEDLDCVFIPNIITPNGDGLNDWLVIPCLDGRGFPENSLVIYNQWGDRVFEDKGYTNDPSDPAHPAWRGTLNGEAGQDLPDGVYFFIFKPGPTEAAIKGFIEIFR